MSQAFKSQHERLAAVLAHRSALVGAVLLLARPAGSPSACARRGANGRDEFASGAALTLQASNAVGSPLSPGAVKAADLSSTMTMVLSIALQRRRVDGIVFGDHPITGIARCRAKCREFSDAQKSRRRDRLVGWGTWIRTKINGVRVQFYSFILRYLAVKLVRGAKVVAV